MTTHSETQSDAQSVDPPGAGDGPLLASLLDGMDAGFFALDTDARVTHWNREAERLLGWRSEEAVGRVGLGDWLVRGADAARVHEQLRAVARPAPRAGALPLRKAHEFPLLSRDGRRLLVRAQVIAVQDADGRPAGAACTFQDVHAQLDLERRVALSEALLSGSSWPMVLVDADLRAIAVNEPAGRALAVRPEEASGALLTEFLGSGLAELESALEHTLAGSGPTDPVELWVAVHDGAPPRDGRRSRSGAAPDEGRRCLLSGFLPLGSPLAADAAPLGVAWLFQDVTRARHQAQEAARRRFRDSQLGRAARAAAECPDPLEAAGVHLDFALAGFAEHALLDIFRADPAVVPRQPATNREQDPGGTARLDGLTGTSPGYPPPPRPSGGTGPEPDSDRSEGHGTMDPAVELLPGRQLLRVIQTPTPMGSAAATSGIPLGYRPGHPALEALDRGVPVRATASGTSGGSPPGPAWATARQWPQDAAHALCVTLRSRGREVGVVTFLRGLERPGFDRTDAFYAEDVALRVAAAVDLAGVLT